MSKKKILLKAKLENALALLKKGDLDNAQTLLIQTSKTASGNPDVWFLLGKVKELLGKPEDAIEYQKKCLALDRNHVQAYMAISGLQANLGQHKEAKSNYQRTLKFLPGNADVLNNLGIVLHRLGEYKNAQESFLKAITINPDFASAHNNLANSLIATKCFNDAIKHLLEVVRLKPQTDGIYTLLASTYNKNNELKKAVDFCTRAIIDNPDNIEAHLGLAKIYTYHGKLDKAINSYSSIIDTSPNNIHAYNGICRCLRDSGRLEDALEMYDKALNIESTNAHLISGKADICQRLGRFDEAYSLIKALIRDKRLTSHSLDVMERICHKFNCSEEFITYATDMLKHPHINDDSRKTLHYALARRFDSVENYEMSYKHYCDANALENYTFDREKHTEKINKIIKIFNKDEYANYPHSTNHSRRPVFIIGMPRSGTSLVEQIISSHPKVYGAGELIKFNEITTSLHRICGLDTKYPECMPLLKTADLDTIAENYLAYLNGIDNKLERITDKMPQNFFHLGLIALVFPQAAIIHCTRNQMDTCLSIFFQSFNASHPYSTDLGNIAFFYNSYLRLMKHWDNILDIPVLNVNYEELVANQERLSKEIISFCELEWDDACLTFYKSSRHVATASFNQVKKPVYTKSVNRWQHYKPFIKDLVDELSQN